MMMMSQQLLTQSEDTVTVEHVHYVKGINQGIYILTNTRL